ncbi:hypothetical protein OAM44_02525 [Pelagibacteraceae bacterium]|jgi:glyceraldehyde 3-phosphate dehydrogenase|nr:hypothetical protein [Pelagibacteraceae bacterium]
MIITGVNGFGRFGLHFLKYYLSNNKKTKFKISYINDEKLNINQILHIINNDTYLDFKKYKFTQKGNNLFFLLNKKWQSILFTKKKLSKLKWTNYVDFLLECSGNYSSIKKLNFIKKTKNIKHVLISSTSWDCDKTLIYGFNHLKFKTNDKFISYGSCTVNAYMVLTQFIIKYFGLVSSDVNIIHNLPEYKAINFKTIKKHPCTLEGMAPKLIKSLNKNNFLVNYTHIPYSGVSMIDFRFALKKKITLSHFNRVLKSNIKKGMLKNLYGVSSKDKDPNFFKESKNNCEIILEKNILKNKNLYLFSYFDNENSANRFFDLTNFIAKKYI